MNADDQKIWNQLAVLLKGGIVKINQARLDDKVAATDDSRDNAIAQLCFGVHCLSRQMVDSDIALRLVSALTRDEKGLSLEDKMMSMTWIVFLQALSENVSPISELISDMQLALGGRLETGKREVVNA